MIMGTENQSKSEESRSGANMHLNGKRFRTQGNKEHNVASEVDEADMEERRTKNETGK
jgi:hypothetical protein